MLRFVREAEGEIISFSYPLFEAQEEKKPRLEPWQRRSAMTAPTSRTDFITLAEEHRQELLVGSGIDPAVIEERGYKTVWGSSDPALLRAGFKESQRRGSGWIAPLFSPLGGKEYIYKPTADPRRNAHGKIIKYEYPSGHGMILDAHPRTLPLLGAPGVRLWIPEGIKKGDALVSRGEAALSLQGIYGWRGKNAVGGATALADWEQVALNGRDVLIVFDSDATSNPNVASARARLARFLKARGAHVLIVHLPAGPGGAKQGADDYLVAGGVL